MLEERLRNFSLGLMEHIVVPILEGTVRAKRVLCST